MAVRVASQALPESRVCIATRVVANRKRKHALESSHAAWLRRSCVHGRNVCISLVNTKFWHWRAGGDWHTAYLLLYRAQRVPESAATAVGKGGARKEAEVAPLAQNAPTAAAP